MIKERTTSVTLSLSNGLFSDINEVFIWLLSRPIKRTTQVVLRELHLGNQARWTREGWRTEVSMQKGTRSRR